MTIAWTLLCHACGFKFEKKGWFIGMRFGVGGLPNWAWYYLRCPQCNRRHWNKLVRVLAE